MGGCYATKCGFVGSGDKRHAATAVDAYALQRDANDVCSTSGRIVPAATFAYLGGLQQFRTEAEPANYVVITTIAHKHAT